MHRLFVVLASLIVALLPMMTFAQEELPPAPDVPPGVESASIFDGLLMMSNESLLMMVAGVVISLIMAVPIRQTWGDDVKAVAVFLVCVAFGAIYTLSLAEWETADLGRRVLLIMATATGFYLLFKGPMRAFTARTDALLKRGTTSET
jgi:uncharacterized membrane protein YfcA